MRSTEIEPILRAVIDIVTFGMCQQAVELLYKARGGSAVYSGSVLERCLRDLITMNQHVVNSTRTFKMAGRLLFGLPAEEWTF